MGIHYKKTKPYLRTITTITRGERVAVALRLEGDVWTDNGFYPGDVVVVRPIKKGRMLIELDKFND
jgi:hypothetical protein|tara:strand:- start:999 stop:1196 length:198 start_codon:yes stop_codon:yes gene_type:complete